MCPRARSFVRTEIHRKQTVSETVEKAHATLPPVLDALFTRDPGRGAGRTARRGARVRAGVPAPASPTRTSKQLGTDHLFAMTRSAFAFTDSRGNHPSAVRVFVPTLEDHGYTCAGTILETNTDDSPFLVDSVTEELAARELRVRFLIHPVVGTARDEDGHLERVMSGRDASHRESVMHVEIERHLSDAERADLEAKVRDILHDVRLVVRDFEPMQDRVTHMMELARHATVRYSPQEVGETVDFLDWLLQLNFVLLGYREYDLLDTPEGRAIQATPASGLGILSDIGRSTFAASTPLASLPEHVRSRIEDGDLLVNAKTSAYSTVHRRAPMDYIGVRKVSPDGAIVGEARLLGLFTQQGLHGARREDPAAAPQARADHRGGGPDPRFARLQGGRRALRVVPEGRAVPGDGRGAAHDSSSACCSWRRRPGSACWSARTCSGDRSRSSSRCPASASARRSASGCRTCSASASAARPSTTTCRSARRSRRRSSSRSTSSRACRSRRSRTRSSRPRSNASRGRGTTTSSTPCRARFGERARRGARDDLRGRASPTTTRPPTRTGPSSPRTSSTSRSSDASSDGFVVGIGNETAGERLTRVRLYKTGGKVDLSAFMPLLESLGLRVVEEVPVHLRGRGPRVHPRLRGARLPRRRPRSRVRGTDGARGDRRDVAGRGRGRFAEPARDLLRAHLAAGPGPARLPEVPDAGLDALHRGVPQRRDGEQPADLRGRSSACSTRSSIPPTSPRSGMSRGSR